MSKRENICIFTAQLAKQLLKLGYAITDIKPLKENPDRTIFVFRNDNDLEKTIRVLTQNQ